MLTPYQALPIQVLKIPKEEVVNILLPVTKCALAQPEMNESIEIKFRRSEASDFSEKMC